jgi:predicted amidohydrolase
MPDVHRFRVGITQWHVTRDRAANLDIACDLVRQCAADGANLVLLPENGLHLGTNLEMREAALRTDSPELKRLADVARKTKTPVLLGGFKHIGDDGVIRNSAMLYDEQGDLVAVYDKIHLFDARINGQSFEASSVEKAGMLPLLVEIDGVKVGVTICYDVRFPELYRRLALAGAEVILVPAAFTQTTGEAHWETLLRARAIENECFIVASTTVRGTDGTDAFETYGHGLVVEPWGKVLVDLGIESPTCRVVELDLGQVASAREKLPVLHHVRPEAYGNKPAFVSLARQSTEGAA